MSEIQDEVSLIIDSKVIYSNRSLLKEKSLYFEAMFRDEFVEKLKSEITLHDIDYLSFNYILDGCKSNKPIFLTDSNVFDIIRVSGMLQFISVYEQCKNYITENIKFSNALEIMTEMDAISEVNLHAMAKKFVLSNFVKCFSYALVFAQELNLDIVKSIINSNFLYVKREFDVFKVIVDWITFSNERSSHALELLLCIRISELSDLERDQLFSSDIFVNLEEKEKVLISSSNKGPRCPPFYPCVVGHVARKVSQDPEIRSHRRLRDSSLFMFDPASKKLTPIATLNKVNDGTCEATGYKVLAHGHDVIISGGEFTIGRNKWNKMIWSYNTLTSKWNKLLSLLDPQRHHSVCSIGEKIYLVGGYGKHRCVLDSVIVIDLETCDIKNLEPLPIPMYSPAICSFGENSIYIFKSEICVYDVNKNRWSRLSKIAMPKMEFCNALSFKNRIYLTSANSHELYCFVPNNDESLKLVGKFYFEVQNVCLVNGIIYSFTSDQFDCKSYIECYDCNKDVFSRLWEEESEEVDFSAYFSFGCFPLLIHED